MTKIKIIKTLDPVKIPEGSIGTTFADISKPGMHIAFFVEYTIFVYSNEIEVMK